MTTAASSELYADAEREVRDVAEPLLDAPAIQRLGRISFLGGLAPEHRGLPSHAGDGNRLDHSIGVAWLAMQAAHTWGLAPSAVSLAAAWGLVHDVATFALSHTSEPPFCRLLACSAAVIRRQMVLGDPALPPELRLAKPLADMGVEPASVLALFGSVPSHATPHAWLVRHLVRSPLTPDTLEGIWRAGRTFGVPVPDPLDVLVSLRATASSFVVRRAHVAVVLEFWSAKDEVYRRHINSRAAIGFESLWSRQILALYRSLDVERAFAAADRDLHAAKPERGQLAFDWGDEFRYKPPLRYVVDDHALPEGDVTLQALESVLRKEPKH